QEMSKSKGIIVRPEEVIEKYGRDLLRYYILTKDVSKNWNWEWDEVEEAFDFMNILWNTFNYRDTYTEEREEPENLEVEDRWILSRLNSMVEEVKKYSSEPELTAYRAVREIEDFAANDLSRTYIKMIRDRLRPGYDGEDRKAAEWTLREVTDQLLKVLAPFTPYLADYRWEGEDSIHLEEYPEVDRNRIDPDLERSMEIFQEVEEAVSRLRQREGINLRHPVKKVTVGGGEEVEEAVDRLGDLMEERLNAKDVGFETVELQYEVKLDYERAGPELGGDIPKVEAGLEERDHQELAERLESGENVEIAERSLDPGLFEIRTHVPEDRQGEEFSRGTVYLDTERTEELQREAFVNEVIRAVQQERKEAGLDVEDEVNLSFSGDVEPLQEFEDRIRDRVNISEIDFSGRDYDYGGKVEFNGNKAGFSFSTPV
ncbi:MAG: class I tRNA ligase family protein, partial [Candidatus Nanohaloarchaea archaeon]